MATVQDDNEIVSICVSLRINALINAKDTPVAAL
jgi:hypothetical protein